MKARVCELCDQEASLYCPSDSAFLCSRCDARVHQANFLVARHIRQSICYNCKGLAGSRNLRSLCSSCAPDNFSGHGSGDGDTQSSSSACSACVSSTDSFGGTAATKAGFDNRKSESSVTQVSSKLSNIPARFSGEKRKCVQRARARTSTSVDAKAEGSFVNWCSKLGLNGNYTAAVVSTASNALGFCLGRLTGVPLRVCLAASFWFGLRFCGDRSVSTRQNLRRIEELSGVPAKLILAVEAKLGRELRIRRARRDDLEEGWAEC
ncbi:unnamed protein product [Prunus armeniaca]|uniref:B box-type domain-containing protein n=1 Tax=Prunus armeniaca TaxID=36596 RepID=A0A6J5WQH2_PRUAR|nr:unnamed protein product [Prunus armeniaca]CAB4302543.1 unnamed protein product [Prunus armeniaca]